MRILLINPNKVSCPPVPPIGLEYLAGSLQRQGQSVSILDLTFSLNAFEAIDQALNEFLPDIVGMTIRNIDSVLFHENEFYLDHIRDLINYIKDRHLLRVIVGGAGVRINPEGVLEYLKADFLVTGPVEGIINDLLDTIASGYTTQKIWQGSFPPYSTCSRITEGIDYPAYYAAGGVAGFETHKGCSSSCVYCIEAASPVSFKKPEDVIREIKEFVDKGHCYFHLCDAEFNEDLDHSLDFCTALKRAGMPIEWALYMKPANYNNKLFRLMKDTGVTLITLTVDSFRKCPLYWADVEKIIYISRSAGIRLVVDFLTGLPYEDEELLKWCIDFFRRLQPDRVNINTYIRLYRNIAVAKIVEADNALAPYIIGSRDDQAMIMPAFYNHIRPDRLRELISMDSIFAVEGDNKGVNYMKR